MHTQVALSLAERVIAQQGWQLATSLLCLCAEALAADLARSDTSVGAIYEATAGCSDAAASHNGVSDSAAAARAAAARRSLHSEGGAADVAIGAWRHGYNADKRSNAMAGVVLAVALLDRVAAYVILVERRAGSCQVKAGPHILHARGGTVYTVAPADPRSDLGLDLHIVHHGTIDDAATHAPSFHCGLADS